MKVVKVYGKLRELLGQCRFELNVSTPAQAFKALLINFPKLEKFILDSEKDGVAYRMMVGRQHIGEDNLGDLALPLGSREVFSIAPVIVGAGGGFGRLALGVGLIGASFLFPGAGLFGTTGIAGGVAGGGAAGVVGVSSVAVLNATTIGTALSAVGAGLVLGGVAQIISPTPTPTALKEQEQLESFTFSGIVNVSRQGIPVPVVLGRAYAGSVVVSSGLDVV
jgi:predicted phage tail protein|tara:strand:- start:767 stop:1432 length:666 start_codon:yes stop_codon:yes gene_type:complete